MICFLEKFVFFFDRKFDIVDRSKLQVKSNFFNQSSKFKNYIKVDTSKFEKAKFKVHFWKVWKIKVQSLIFKSLKVRSSSYAHSTEIFKLNFVTRKYFVGIQPTSIIRQRRCFFFDNSIFLRRQNILNTKCKTSIQ